MMLSTSQCHNVFSEKMRVFFQMTYYLTKDNKQQTSTTDTAENHHPVTKNRGMPEVGKYYLFL